MNQPTESKRTAGEWKVFAGTGISTDGLDETLLAWTPEENQTGGKIKFWETRANAQFIAMSGTIANRIDESTEFDGAKAIECLPELLNALVAIRTWLVAPLKSKEITDRFHGVADTALSRCRKEGGA